jgi:hypothetical protein
MGSSVMMRCGSVVVSVVAVVVLMGVSGVCGEAHWIPAPSSALSLATGKTSLSPEEAHFVVGGVVGGGESGVWEEEKQKQKQTQKQNAYELTSSGGNTGTWWDFLLFVASWPQATCLVTKDRCIIPKYVYMCIYVHVYAYMCVCVLYVYMYVDVYVCMCMCMCMCGVG